MRSALFVVTFFLGLTSLNTSAAITEDHLYAAPETLWVKNQGIQIVSDNIQLSPSNHFPDLDFQPRNPKALLEKGELSLQRKILLNASGTEISTDVFMWDLQLEVNYKFI
jgi:hypothetical protein